MDGDGTETNGTGGAPATINFDHNADGLKTGTGWLKPDDAWLVLDRNGNGSIDSGRELFGVDTRITTVIQPSASNRLLEPVTVTRNATSGFEALRALDANGDLDFTAADPLFAQVRLWQDLNQDGISQAGELATLAAKGITGISLRDTAVAQDLGNGNSISATAVVSRSSGVATQASAVTLAAANLELADNPFFRTFPDQVPLTEHARALPEMGGSGVVRDLREAMSLSPELAALVQQFAEAPTRDAQRALLVPLLLQWRASVAADPSLGDASKAVAGVQTYWQFGNPAQGPSVTYNLSFISTGTAAHTARLKQFSQQAGAAVPTAEAGLLQLLSALQAFNGQAMWELSSTPGAPFSSLRFPSGELMAGALVGDGSSGDSLIWFPMAFGNLALNALLESFQALEESVYGSLVMQTRLKPYLDAVELVIDEAGLHFDTAPLASMLQAAYTADPRRGLDDLVDLLRHASGTLDALDFDGMGLLSQWAQALPADSPLLAHLRNDLGVLLAPGQGTPTSNHDIVFGDATPNGWMAGDGDDVLAGGAGDDDLRGDGGHDVLLGGDGNDQLTGGAGNDILWGGAGSDRLAGGDGADLYRMAPGSGQDFIANFDTDAPGQNADTLRLGAGTHTGNVMLRRSGLDVVLSVAGSTDTVTLTGQLMQDGASAHAVDYIQFGDGTLWDVAAMKQRLLQSTSGDDVIQGYGSDDTLAGGDGADSLFGQGGADTLQGDAGADRLYGEAGHDFLQGGAGNDQLTGGDGADTYRFEPGWGSDAVFNLDADAAGTAPDALLFEAGVLPAHLQLQRSLDHLLIVRAGSTDVVTVQNFFAADAGTQAVVDEVRFSDGTRWTLADLKLKALQGGAGNDLLIGYASDDSLAGQAGNDLLYGRAGADTLVGGAGADKLYGEGGADILWGDDGDDSLDGGEGADQLLAGAGNDSLLGGAGADTLNGEAGNDALYGGEGADTYLFGIGSGQDTVVNGDADALGANADSLALGAGLTAANLLLRRQGDSLVLTVTGTVADKLTVSGYFAADAATSQAVEALRFADGSTWDVATVKQKVLLPTAAADQLTGYAGNDSVSGGADHDTLQGRAGNDTLDGGTENDNLDGGDGHDTLLGGTGTDTLAGGAGNDVLYGGAGDDTLQGNTGADTYRLERGGGRDTVNNLDTDGLAGTQPDQVLVGTGLLPAELVATRAGLDLVLALRGTDDRIVVTNHFASDAASDFSLDGVRFADGSTWSAAQLKALVLQATEGNDVLTGYASADALAGGNGDDSLSGQAGADTLDGGAGDDALSGGAGADTLAGGAGRDNLAGDADSDLLLGGEHNDTLGGGDGADVLDGGAGNDSLAGGNGADTYRFGRGSGQDDITNGDADALGVAADLVEFGAGIAPADVTVTRSADDLVLLLNSSDDRLRVRSYFRLDGTTTDVVEQLRFADGTAWAYAAVKARVVPAPVPATATVNGTAGADTLVGGASHDTFFAGTGADTLHFGPGQGKDLLYLADASPTEVDTVLLAPGTTPADLLLTRGVGDSLVLALAGRSDTLTVAGHFNADATAGGQVDRIQFADSTVWDQAAIKARVTTPTSGYDQITGYAGADTLQGGAGDDSLFGRAGDDRLDGGDDKDTLWGEDGADTLLGGRQADTLMGGTGNDRLEGGDGADTLRGDAGDDWLDGGAGDDNLDGGAGNDTYLLARGGGKDVLAMYDATAGRLETLRVADGLVQADVTVRRDNNDLVVGLRGSADSVRVQYHFLSDAAGPYRLDRVLFGDGSTWSLAQLNNLAMAGSTEADRLWGLSGADTLNGLEADDQLWGESGNDTLTGGSGHDQLYGGDGDDVLNGGTGNDQQAGGAGHDTYLVDMPGDTTSEAPNQGTDTVQAALDWVLADNLENLTLTGTAASGTGNALDNLITGNALNNTLSGGAGNDRLDGGAGADVLRGGAGHDTYVVNTASDQVIELAGEGIDTVLATVSATLGAEVENLTLQTGQTAIAATGNALANVLTGNAMANTLAGGAGDDLLAGGLGGDTYRFERGWGVDTVRENDATAGVVDRVLLGAGIAAADLAWARTGNNLMATLNGGADRLVLENWYLGTAYQVERFQFADASVLTAAQVQALAAAPLSAPAMVGSPEGASAEGQYLGLVSAMAMFAPEPMPEGLRTERPGTWRIPDLPANVLA